MRSRSRLPINTASRIALGLAGLNCDGSTGVQVGPPSAVVIVSGQDQVAIVGQELSESLVAKVLDAANRAIPGRALRFVVTSGGGVVSPAEVLTTQEGVAATHWTLGTKTTDPQRAEAQLLEPTTGEKLLSVEFRATSGAGAVTKVVKIGGDSQTAAVGTAVAIQPAVAVSDQYDNPVPDKDVVWQIVANGGTIAGSASATSRTDANGIATLPAAWTLGQSIGIHTLTARAESLDPVPFTAVAFAGAPAQLGFVVAPSAVATNGDQLPRQPVLQLQDQYGNASRVGDVVVQITQIAGSGPGSLLIWNDTTKTNGDGIASFTGTTINGAIGDGYRLGFATPTTPTLSSDPITLLRGQPYKLAIRIPAAGAMRGSAFAVQPVLQAVDAGGNATTVAQCVNARISLGATLIGITQLSVVGDTFAFPNLGVSAASDAGTFTITYNTGCCLPDAALIPASQEIQVP